MLKAQQLRLEIVGAPEQSPIQVFAPYGTDQALDERM
jgi:hypothetical protein